MRLKAHKFKFNYIITPSPSQGAPVLGITVEYTNQNWLFTRERLGVMCQFCTNCQPFSPTLAPPSWGGNEIYQHL